MRENPRAAEESADAATGDDSRLPISLRNDADDGLRELANLWPGLAASVRDAIMQLARACRR